MRANVTTLLQAELARQRLREFARVVMPHLNVDAPHFVAMCEHLEAVVRGDIRHLMILVPPRHSKTTVGSKLFPAWLVGLYNLLEIILASNVASLASDNSRVARDIVQSIEYPFPNVKARDDATSAELWRTTNNCVVKSVGVGSAVQGRGASYLMVDDPIASAEEASELALERQWQWFTQDAMRRLLPGAHVVIEMYRWKDGDLAGRILEDPELKKEFTVLRLPVYAEAGDPLGRAEGELLFPRSTGPDGRPCGFTSAEIELQRRFDARSFAAQYLLDPVPGGGAIFKPEWFEHRFEEAPRRRLVRKVRDVYAGLHRESEVYGEPIKIMAIDSAWKTGLANDRSAIATIVSDHIDMYVTDLWVGRAEYTDLRRIVMQQYEKHLPSRIYCEEASSGFALIQQLRTETRIPIIGVPPGRESKEARAEALTGWFECGRVKFPRYASWMNELLFEFLRFPHGRHDDIVDAVCLGVKSMLHSWALTDMYDKPLPRVMDNGPGAIAFFGR
jgi:predicted phage terminase large subunit-like protein